MEERVGHRGGAWGVAMGGTGPPEIWSSAKNWLHIWCNDDNSDDPGCTYCLWLIRVTNGSYLSIISLRSESPIDCWYHNIVSYELIEWLQLIVADSERRPKMAGGSWRTSLHSEKRDKKIRGKTKLVFKRPDKLNLNPQESQRIGRVILLFLIMLT